MVTDDEGAFEAQVPASALADGSLVLTAAGDGFLERSRVVEVGRAERVEIVIGLGRLPRQVDGSTGLVAFKSVRSRSTGQITYDVEVRNATAGVVRDVVIRDTLDPAFTGSLDSGRVEVGAEFADRAVVSVGNDGRSFEVALGDLEPSAGFRKAYSLSVILPAEFGVFCNHVSAAGDGPDGEVGDRESACIASSLEVPDLDQEDGRMDQGSFDPSVERFAPGDPVVYELSIANATVIPVTGIEIADTLGAERGLLELDAIADGFPTRGRVVETGAADFRWSIERLDPGEEAHLRFVATASAEGTDVNRVTARMDQVLVPLRHEEATEIGAVP